MKIAQNPAGHREGDIDQLPGLASANAARPAPSLLLRASPGANGQP